MRDKRKGEADPILDIIESLSIISLLPTGTITRRQRKKELIINLMLIIAKLADARLCCHIYDT